MSIQQNPDEILMLPVTMRVPNAQCIYHLSQMRQPRGGERMRPLSHKSLLCLDGNVTDPDQMSQIAVKITFYGDDVDCWYVKASDLQSLSNEAHSQVSEPVNAVAEADAPAFIDLSELPAFEYWQVTHEAE